MKDALKAKISELIENPAVKKDFDANYAVSDYSLDGEEYRCVSLQQKNDKYKSRVELSNVYDNSVFCSSKSVKEFMEKEELEDYMSALESYYGLMDALDAADAAEIVALLGF